MIEYQLNLIIILIGFYGLMTSRNIIKTIICLNMTQSAVILFFLNLVNKQNGQIPVFPGEKALMVDPTPQALMITAIVIGVSITALSLMMSIKLFHHYGTLDWKEIIKRK